METEFEKLAKIYREYQETKDRIKLAEALAKIRKQEQDKPTKVRKKNHGITAADAAPPMSDINKAHKSIGSVGKSSVLGSNAGKDVDKREKAEEDFSKAQQSIDNAKGNARTLGEDAFQDYAKAQKGDTEKEWKALEAILKLFNLNDDKEKELHGAAKEKGLVKDEEVERASPSFSRSSSQEPQGRRRTEGKGENMDDERRLYSASGVDPKIWDDMMNEIYAHKKLHDTQSLRARFESVNAKEVPPQADKENPHVRVYDDGMMKLSITGKEKQRSLNSTIDGKPFEVKNHRNIKIDIEKGPAVNLFAMKDQFGNETGKSFVMEFEAGDNPKLKNTHPSMDKIKFTKEPPTKDDVAYIEEDGKKTIVPINAKRLYGYKQEQSKAQEVGKDRDTITKPQERVQSPRSHDRGAEFGIERDPRSPVAPQQPVSPKRPVTAQKSDASKASQHSAKAPTMSATKHPAQAAPIVGEHKSVEQVPLTPKPSKVQPSLKPTVAGPPPPGSARAEASSFVGSQRPDIDNVTLVRDALSDMNRAQEKAKTAEVPKTTPKTPPARSASVSPSSRGKENTSEVNKERSASVSPTVRKTKQDHSLNDLDHSKVDVHLQAQDFAHAAQYEHKPQAKHATPSAPSLKEAQVKASSLNEVAEKDAEKRNEALYGAYKKYCRARSDGEDNAKAAATKELGEKFGSLKDPERNAALGLFEDNAKKTITFLHPISGKYNPKSKEEMDKIFNNDQITNRLIVRENSQEFTASNPAFGKEWVSSKKPQAKKAEVKTTAANEPLSPVSQPEAREVTSTKRTSDKSPARRGRSDTPKFQIPRKTATDLFGENKAGILPSKDMALKGHFAAASQKSKSVFVPTQPESNARSAPEVPLSDADKAEIKRMMTEKPDKFEAHLTEVAKEKEPGYKGAEVPLEDKQDRETVRRMANNSLQGLTSCVQEVREEIRNERAQISAIRRDGLSHTDLSASTAAVEAPKQGVKSEVTPRGRSASVGGNNSISSKSPTEGVNVTSERLVQTMVKQSKDRKSRSIPPLARKKEKASQLSP